MYILKKTTSLPECQVLYIYYIYICIYRNIIGVQKQGSVFIMVSSEEREVWRTYLVSFEILSTVVERTNEVGRV